MFVEIVFVGLPIDRDDVEEALETAFELDGEVTVAGSGMGRCPLDLEIAESRTGAIQVALLDDTCRPTPDSWCSAVSNSKRPRRKEGGCAVPALEGGGGQSGVAPRR